MNRCVRLPAREAGSEEDVARKLRAALNIWLFSHILGEDGRFGAWLRANGHDATEVAHPSLDADPGSPRAPA